LYPEGEPYSLLGDLEILSVKCHAEQVKKSWQQAWQRNLTGRELGVLTLLARGKSNKEIGANLFISETTVERHLPQHFHQAECSQPQGSDHSRKPARGWCSFSATGLLERRLQPAATKNARRPCLTIAQSVYFRANAAGHA